MPGGTIQFSTLTVTGIPYIAFVDNQTYADVRTMPTGGGSTSAVAMDTSATLEFVGWYRT
jgi:hypothetical protein